MTDQTVCGKFSLQIGHHAVKGMLLFAYRSYSFINVSAIREVTALTSGAWCPVSLTVNVKNLGAVADNGIDQMTGTQQTC